MVVNSVLQNSLAALLGVNKGLEQSLSRSIQSNSPPDPFAGRIDVGIRKQSMEDYQQSRPPYYTGTSMSWNWGATSYYRPPEPPKPLHERVQEALGRMAYHGFVNHEHTLFIQYAQALLNLLEEPEEKPSYEVFRTNPKRFW